MKYLICYVLLSCNVVAITDELARVAGSNIGIDAGKAKTWCFLLLARIEI